MSLPAVFLSVLSGCLTNSLIDYLPQKAPPSPQQAPPDWLLLGMGSGVLR